MALFDFSVLDWKDPFLQVLFFCIPLAYLFYVMNLPAVKSQKLKTSVFSYFNKMWNYLNLIPHFVCPDNQPWSAIVKLAFIP